MVVLTADVFQLFIKSTHSYDTVYQVQNSNNNIVIFWNMTNIHVVPDRQQYTGLRQAHMLYWIDNNCQYDRQRRYDTWYKHVIVNLLERIFDNFQTTTQHPH